MAPNGFVLSTSSSSLPRQTINGALEKMYSTKHTHSHSHRPTWIGIFKRNIYSSWLRCRCFGWPPLPLANLQFCGNRKIKCIFPPRQCSGCQPIAMAGLVCDCELPQRFSFSFSFHNLQSPFDVHKTEHKLFSVMNHIQGNLQMQQRSTYTAQQKRNLLFIFRCRAVAQSRAKEKEKGRKGPTATYMQTFAIFFCFGFISWMRTEISK